MFNLDLAECYDCETFPNVFTLHMELLHSETSATWEISAFRDDRHALFQHFEYLRANQIPMIGFFSVTFDYPIIHYIWSNPQCTVAEIYAKSQAVMSGDRFAHVIWERDRFAPQIDLAKVHHFDNRAKTTSLKALQINMRSPTVVDSPVEFGTPLTREQIERDLIPYNRHDVKETKRFAHYSMGALNFRIGLIDQFGIDALNYSDVKIGAKMLEQRLGDDVCYDRSSGYKRPRQTPRYRIALADIIFPYIRFNNPEFARVLEFMKAQVLTPDDLDDPDAPIRTKGAFTNLTAAVGGLTFYFGTGGVHASVSAQRFIASEDWPIVDIDVEGLYPNIAIANRLAPEHLGEAFISEYAKIPIERKTHKKGTYQNAALKLAANGPWGQSNNKFTIFFDPKYAMTIPINGQLMICMLVEWLLAVPTIRLIQANTDGITYRIHTSFEPQAGAICKQWEEYTRLTLEHTYYQRLWIRDVNNYLAEDMSGKLKQKGAYWHPNPFDYAESISTASPPAWYKDLSNIVSVRAAVTAMLHNIDPAAYIMAHSDPFDFMCRARATAGSRLTLGGAPIQRTLRYYVARQGAPLVKISPPAGPLGAYKRANGINEIDYNRRMAETGGEWAADVCTKNRSKYEQRETHIEAGWMIADCSDASAFRFDNVNYEYYIGEARKLII